MKKQKWVIALFFAILFLGIFFRTYQFHDFLRFNADQSRDAGVVSDYLGGETPLPLLGPKAGGTDFRVGPMFYHFQIMSAWVFGDAPDSVAYPDLLFSILAIPLLFFFLRKYFDVRTAFLLSVVFSVSFYAVRYSRFAWNPNSLPFWSMLFLYALHGVALAKERAGIRLSVLAGMALGVGVQLHTFSLILFPIVSVIVFGFLLFRKKTQWKLFFIMIVVALLLNVSQITSEIRTGGANTQAFFSGVGTKEKKGSGLIKNILKDTVCHTQANVYILSSYDSDDGCSLKSVKKGLNLPVFIAGLLFFIGGLFLALRAFRRETDLSRRYFLGIVFLYLGLSFCILIPLANEISMRFFLAMIFMPFVLLGLWFEYFSKKFGKCGYRMVIAFTLLLLSVNIFSIQKSFSLSSSYLSDSNAGMDNVMLREVEIASSFITSHAGDAKTVAVDGDAQYLFKALKSMDYFTSREGIRLIQKNKKTDPSLPVFLIENTKQTDDILESRPVDDHLSFGRFTIFSFK